MQDKEPKMNATMNAKNCLQNSDTKINTKMAYKVEIKMSLKKLASDMDCLVFPTLLLIVWWTM